MLYIDKMKLEVARTSDKTKNLTLKSNTFPGINTIKLRFSHYVSSVFAKIPLKTEQ